jgi:Domain of unknown function (DUF4440)
MSLRAAAILAVATLFACSAAARADCDRPALKNQTHDVETVQRLERGWSTAFGTGDTEYEACLLTQDFMEIRSDGKINKLEDELALAARHKGETPAASSSPLSPVHMHGDVAVAYGISSSARMVDGKPYKRYYADYYVWKDGAWHVFFAQQTSFPVMVE